MERARSGGVSVAGRFLAFAIRARIPKNAEQELENMQNNLDNVIALKQGAIAREQARFDARHFELAERHMQERRTVMGQEGARAMPELRWNHYEYETPQELQIEESEGPELRI